MLLRSVPNTTGHAAAKLGVNETIRPIHFVNMSTAASTSPKLTQGTSVMTMMDERMVNTLKYHLPTTSAMARANFPSDDL